MNLNNLKFILFYISCHGLKAAKEIENQLEMSFTNDDNVIVVSFGSKKEFVRTHVRTRSLSGLLKRQSAAEGCERTNRICVGRQQLPDGSPFNIYYPTNLIPQGLSPDQYELNLYSGDSTQVNNACSPVGQLIATIPIFATINVAPNVNASQIIMPLPQSSLNVANQNENKFYFQMKAGNQCLLGPDVAGTFTPFVPVDLSRLIAQNATSTTTTASSTTSTTSTTTTISITTTTTTTTSTNSPASEKSDFELPLVKILVLSAVAVFILLSTILLCCLWKRRRAREVEEEDDESTIKAPPTHDEIARRLSSALDYDSFRLPSLSSMEQENDDINTKEYFDRADIPPIEFDQFGTPIFPFGVGEDVVTSVNLDSHLQSSSSASTSSNNLDRSLSNSTNGDKLDGAESKSTQGSTPKVMQPISSAAKTLQIKSDTFDSPMIVSGGGGGYVSPPESYQTANRSHDSYHSAQTPSIFEYPTSDEESEIQHRTVSSKRYGGFQQMDPISEFSMNEI